MKQLSFLGSDDIDQTATAGRRALDADSERLLKIFQAARLKQGAHPQSVRREVSQLRAIAREAGMVSQSSSLRALFADVSLVARVLREPRMMIARSTGRARLLAAQRFIQIMGRRLGRTPVADLAGLDALLPAGPSAGWHTVGTLVAGTTGRRRRRGPTLDASDLRRIVDGAAGSSSPEQAQRDRALVALHCYSGLRPEEIVRLRWEDVTTDLTSTGHFGLMASIERKGRRVRLLIPGPAADQIETLASAMSGPSGALSGPVFRARGAPDCQLSYRAARVVLGDACRRAGLPSVDSTALRSACAHWLRSQGLSDHEVAKVLGLARVRSVDRLLQRHAALDAQRAVREMRHQ